MTFPHRPDRFDVTELLELPPHLTVINSLIRVAQGHEQCPLQLLHEHPVMLSEINRGKIYSPDFCHRPWLSCHPVVTNNGHRSGIPCELRILTKHQRTDRSPTDLRTLQPFSRSFCSTQIILPSQLNHLTRERKCVEHLRR